VQYCGPLTSELVFACIIKYENCRTRSCRVSVCLCGVVCLCSRSECGRGLGFSMDRIFSKPSGLEWLCGTPSILCDNVGWLFTQDKAERIFIFTPLCTFVGRFSGRGRLTGYL
jgi:hypothetical protein